ncbi:MAG: dephospho-CoA kinase [Thermodesulfobacteriota bacterium]|jgi:dephospho-CoA kinase|nr:MAG: dephospho-CoA kinase [Thermodesulfobacteriota bacterium]
MLIVGLTGGIASGKTTIADMFKKEGAYIIDIDMISREVVKPGKPAWGEVVHIFGKEVLNEDQTLNRKKVGDIVFSDAEKRKKLEDIIHPEIAKERLIKINEIAKKNDRAIVIIDVPLLIETNKQDTVDKVVLVYTSPQGQVERMVKRDGFSLEEANNRLAAQMPIEKKKKFAHFIITNDGPCEKIQKEVKKIFRELKKEEAQKRKKF